MFRRFEGGGAELEPESSCKEEAASLVVENGLLGGNGLLRGNGDDSFIYQLEITAKLVGKLTDW